MATERATFDSIEWLRQHVEFRPADPVAFIYDQVESQSGRCLPIIYQAFDGTLRSHFVDRGQILDFALTSAGRVLDFGPGDGWPSLLIAPMVKEVVGVDGSRRRVEVCRRNAERLGIQNATFVHVPSGSPLPFPDANFDGVVAASSIEQTPNPREVLRELRRVLKPDGRLRMDYESLEMYRGGSERELWLFGDGASCRVIFFDRDLAAERARHYAVVLSVSRKELEVLAKHHGVELKYPQLSAEFLEAMRPLMVSAGSWTTIHPRCGTWLAWLGEAGLLARATYSGGWFARRFFDRLPADQRPCKLAEVDRLLRPLVEIVVEMGAPPESSQPIPTISACADNPSSEH